MTMVIHINTDVLRIKSEGLHNLAQSVARYSEELYEIESKVNQMTALSECAVPIRVQTERLMEEARALLKSAQALEEISVRYEASERSSVEEVYEGTMTAQNYMRAGQVKSIDPSKIGSFW